MSGYFDFTFSQSIGVGNMIGAINSTAVVELDFRTDDPVFAGHYPDYPVVPASLLTEVCCDMVAAHRGLPSLMQCGWQIARSKFGQGIRPGDRIRFAAVHGDDRSKITVTRGDEQVATLRFERVKGLAEPLDAPDPAPHMHPAFDYLPQRYPLLAIDLVGQDSATDRGVARKFISYSDYCFRKLDRAETARYPVGGVIEGIEQAAASLLAQRWDMADPDHVILVAGLDGIHLNGVAMAGEVIDFVTRIETLTDTLAILSGQARVGDRSITSVAKIYVVRLAVAS